MRCGIPSTEARALPELRRLLSVSSDTPTGHDISLRPAQARRPPLPSTKKLQQVAQIFPDHVSSPFRQVNIGPVLRT
jgi:hypothetical protein